MNDNSSSFSDFCMEKGQEKNLPRHYRILINASGIHCISKGEIYLYFLEIPKEALEQHKAFLEKQWTNPIPFISELRECPLSFFRKAEQGQIVFPFPRKERFYVLAVADEPTQLRFLKQEDLDNAGDEVRTEVVNQYRSWISFYDAIDWKESKKPNLAIEEKLSCDVSFWNKVLSDQEKVLDAIAEGNQRFHMIGESSENVLREVDKLLEDDSFSDIESVLEKHEFYKGKGDALFKACSAIGDNLHIKFNLFEEKDPNVTIEERLYRLCFNSRAYYREITLVEQWWTHSLGPFLGFYGKEGSPVALIPDQKGSYLMIDPEASSRRTVDEELNKELSSTAYQFFRGLPEKTPISNKELFQFALYGKSRIVWFLLFCSAISTLLGLVNPIGANIIFSEVIPNLDENLLLQVTLALVFVASGTAVFNYARNAMLIRFSGLIEYESEEAIWQRFLNLPLRFFRRYTQGDLYMRLLTIQSARKSLTGSFFRVILQALFSFLYFIPMIYYSPLLTLAGVGTVALSIPLLIRGYMANMKYFPQELDCKAKLNENLLQILSGISTIRMAGIEDMAFKLWEKIYFQSKKIQWKLGLIMAWNDAFNSSISILSTLVVYVMIVYILHGGGNEQMTIGIFMAFTTAFGLFTSSITELIHAFFTIIQQGLLVNRSNPLLREPLEVTHGKGSVSDLSGDIRIEDVSFRYSETSNLVLRHVLMHIKPGKFVGITGPSGSGKSTLLRLLIGFEVPAGGAIYYNNMDLRGLDIRQIRDKCGIVLQTSDILDGNLKENINGGGFFKDEEILAALEMAGFKMNMFEFPLGLHTPLSKGGPTLSGGQKQRILLARALVRKPQILLLDEATSFLDGKTQEIVRENLDRLQVTRVVIAHRLSTIKNADYIYVLDKGRVAESGTFQELMDKKGLFFKLAEKQKFSMAS